MPACVAWIPTISTCTFSIFATTTWNGREIDRRLLVGLEWTVWDSIATAVQARLTDEAIAGAVRRMPAEHYALSGKGMEQSLKRRRDHLPEMAHDYYRHLAREVDVHLTDEAEIAAIVDKVIADNPGPAQDYREGKKKAIGFLVGQVMKATKGKANPQLVNRILREKL